MISIIGGDGKEYGPVTFEQLKRWKTEGRVTADTLTRRQGEDTWIKLGERPEFNGSSLPPPFEPRPTPPPLPAREPEIDEEDDGAVVLDSTPAAVASSRPLASLSQRLGAAIIDGTLSMIFAMPGLIMLANEVLQGGGGVEKFNNIKFDEHPVSLAVMLGGMLIPALFQMTFLTTRGQTIGKMIVKIRIVMADTEELPGFFRAVVLRGMLAGLLGSTPYVGWLFSLTDILFVFRSDRRCLHDHLANTKVITLDEEKSK